MGTGIKKTSVGGQALIEGLMMMGPKNAAIAIRKPDGEIVVDIRNLPPKTVLSRIPVIRGIIAFIRQMTLGIKALMYSAEFIDMEEEKPSRFEEFLKKVFGDKLTDLVIYFAVLIAIAFSVGLFIVLPNVIAYFLGFSKTDARGVILYNLFEGVIRIGIFFAYLALASQMKDIKRVWMYHGAEHKTIHAYEHGEELTVENVKKYSTKHPRCGTSFLFLVMIISVIMFSFVGWHSMLVNILLRILLIPLVAGISYEILKIAGRSELKIMNILRAPGLAFQRFTTREPDDSMIEVAITAFNNVTIENDNDKW